MIRTSTGEDLLNPQANLIPYAARKEAEAKAERSSQALERARRVLADAANELRVAEQKAADSEAQHASTLAENIVEGHDVSIGLTVHLLLVEDLNTLRSKHSIAQKALASLSAAHDKDEADLRDAERAIVDAVDRLLADEDIETARQVVDHITQAARLGRALQMTAIQTQLATGKAPPSEVQAAIDRTHPLIDGLHVPINFASGPEAMRLGTDRQARRAALIAGPAGTAGRLNS
jgi:hypothetical protein